ncbi:MAG: hypothetical protein IKO61_10805 [Lachnospiraceae bacterium]|nr:hypothetical protein [Lachnospiraceae bacterium]
MIELTGRSYSSANWWGIAEAGLWIVVSVVVVLTLIMMIMRGHRESRLKSDKCIYVPFIGDKDVSIDTSFLSYEMRTVLFMYVQKPVTWLYRRAERDHPLKRGRARSTGARHCYKESREYLLYFVEDMLESIGELARVGAAIGERRNKFVLFHGYDAQFGRDKEVLSLIMLTDKELVLAERLNVVEEYLRRIYNEMEKRRLNGGMPISEAAAGTDPKDMRVPFMFMESMNHLNSSSFDKIKRFYDEK